MKKLKAIVIRLTILLLIFQLRPEHAEAYSRHGVDREYEAAANKLRFAPAREIDISRSNLRSALIFLAEMSGISYVSLPDDTEGLDKPVTLKITSAPFTALEMLAKSHGIALVFDNGIWYMRPSSEGELIGRMYYIKYNTREDAEGAEDGKLDGKQMLDDIKELLGLPVTGESATIMQEVAQVGNFSDLPFAEAFAQQNLRGKLNDNDASNSKGEAKVIWNPDANTLFVIATRQQHQWIEGYLTTVDKPQPLIAVEVKIFETQRNPSTDFGIDWTGVLNDASSEVAVGIGGSGLAVAAAKYMEKPLTAILTAKDLAMRMDALEQNTNSRNVSYQRAVTRNNRTVEYKSSQEIPFLESTSSINSGVGGTTAANVTTKDVGVVMKMTPKVMANNDVLMALNVEISDLVPGGKIINGNEYPVIFKREYKSPIQVRSGYTVAIAGLDRATDKDIQSGVPILSRVPLLGLAFQQQSKSRDKSKMLIFITPTVLRDSTTRGLTKNPLSLTPDKIKMAPPNFLPNGAVPDSFEDRDYAISFYQNELQALQNIANEGMLSKENLQEIDFIVRSSTIMMNQIRGRMSYKARGMNPRAYSAFRNQYQQLLDINRRANDMLYKNHRDFETWN